MKVTHVGAMLAALAVWGLTASPATGMEWTAFPFTAGQHIDAGRVWVANDTDFLYVRFEAASPWELRETHLHVASTLAEIPANRQGIPVPGQFDYGTCHDPTTPGYVYMIDLPWAVGDALVIAAHAEVVRETAAGIEEETAWGGDDEGPGRRWWRYIEYTVQDPEAESGGGHETAWAFGEKTFQEQGIGNNWGWTFTVTPGDLDGAEYTTPLYAGAGGNTLENGYEVGTVAVTIDGDDLSVTYTLFDGYTMSETHLYVGTEAPASAAPGRFPYKAGDLEDAVEFTFVVDLAPFAGSTQLTLAAHAVVYSEDWD